MTTQDTNSHAVRETSASFHSHSQRPSRCRAFVNKIGPFLITFSLTCNLYTVLIYFVFPYTSVLNIDFKLEESDDGIILHYALFGVYMVLFVLTLWSFLAASCSDPGYVDHGYDIYEKENMPKNERLLWDYLEALGLDPNNSELYTTSGNVTADQIS